MRSVPLWRLLVRDSSSTWGRGIEHLSTGTVLWARCLVRACVAQLTMAQGKGTERRGTGWNLGSWVESQLKLVQVRVYGLLGLVMNLLQCDGEKRQWVVSQ